MSKISILTDDFSLHTKQFTSFLDSAPLFCEDQFALPLFHSYTHSFRVCSEHLLHSSSHATVHSGCCTQKFLSLRQQQTQPQLHPACQIQSNVTVSCRRSLSPFSPSKSYAVQNCQKSSRLTEKARREGERMNLNMQTVLAHWGCTSHSCPSIQGAKVQTSYHFGVCLFSCLGCFSEWIHVRGR